MIPARLGFEEEDVEVVLDWAFINAVELAAGPVEGDWVMKYGLGGMDQA